MMGDRQGKDVPRVVQTPPEGNGGGGVKTKNVVIISLLISVLVTFVMFQFIFAGQMVSRTDFNTNIDLMNQAISKVQNPDMSNYALKTDLDDYAKNNSMSAYVLKDEVVNPDLSNYYTKEEVDAAIEAALEEQEEEEEAVVEDTTRWTFKDAIFIAPVNGVTIEIDAPRIDEADIYDIELDIAYHDPEPGVINTWENTDGEAVVNSAIELTLVPRDYVMVNEDETYLDSDAAPWMDWDTDFTIREREGQDVCRRIVFTSQTYYGEFGDGDGTTLELVLELVY